ncbi:PREDICTED: uncharacterized protein LOC108366099 [Rhagoletis zephyria]|uniref:uncharacterized protein LOC108366099 n=1 Tax=Rhagoletis zephyria TaxID=28612 RepID=UPI00081135E9|nr:PREDICTED: uncharacterized protein LOC108366099 [Rhagoletis zephyria]
MNVANAATKWKKTIEFGPTSTWFSGPGYLHSPCEQWPIYNHESSVTPSKDMELNPEAEHINVHTEFRPIIDPTRFSKWERLERSMAYVKHFIDKCKPEATRKKFDHEQGRSEGLTAEELQWSQRLYRLAQADSYSQEIKMLKKNTDSVLPKLSVLRKLSPFIDNDGVLRQRSRLEYAPIKDSIKNPIILPKNHKITQLLINWYHRKYKHVHHDTVVNEIYQKFHIPSLRRALRTVRYDCQHCKLRKAKPLPPKMGSLPEARLAPYTRPFSYVGIDLFGPFLVTIGRRAEKRYGVLFTCMICRAIHVEIAHSLSMNSCVMVVRNFIRRRGTPVHMFSDNGTNFVATEKELREAFRQLDIGALQMQFTCVETKWTFIPPASPHMGGAWERMIRTFKDVLYQILTP